MESSESCSDLDEYVFREDSQSEYTTKLEPEQAPLQNLLDDLPFGSLILDEEDGVFVVRHANNTLGNILKLGYDDMVRKELSQLLRDHNIDNLKKDLKKVLSNGSSIESTSKISNHSIRILYFSNKSVILLFEQLIKRSDSNINTSESAASNAIIEKSVEFLISDAFSSLKDSWMVSALKLIGAAKEPKNVKSLQGKIETITFTDVESLIKTLDEVENSDYLYQFFLTFRYFITPIHLLRKLIMKYVNSTNNDTPEPEYRSAQKRIIDIIKFWLKEHFYDFKDPDLLRTIRGFVDRVAKYEDAKTIRVLNHLILAQGQRELTAAAEHMHGLGLSSNVNESGRRSPGLAFSGPESGRRSPLNESGRRSPMADSGRRSFDSSRRIPSFEKSSTLAHIPSGEKEDEDKFNELPESTAKILDEISAKALRKIDGIFACAISQMTDRYVVLKHLPPEKKGQEGVPKEVLRIPREESLCSYTILQRDVIIVEDLDKDDRFKSMPLAASYKFYAGAPVISDGRAVGVICIIDDKPRTLTEDEKEVLNDLSREVRDQLKTIPKWNLYKNCEPYELSSHLTFLAYEKFKAIRPSELYFKSWSREDACEKSPNIVGLIAHFNKISNWVVYEIVSETDIKKRVERLKYFIRTATVAYENRDYETTFALVLSLDSPSVTRLRQTWSATDDVTKKQWERLEQFASYKNNYKNYRMTMKNMKRQNTFNAVPYFGLFLKDLASLEENLDTIVKNQVNFQKMRMVASTISEVQQLQKSIFAHVKKIEILSFLMHEIPDGKDEETIFALSKRCEASGEKSSFFKSLSFRTRSKDVEVQQKISNPLHGQTAISPKDKRRSYALEDHDEDEKLDAPSYLSTSLSEYPQPSGLDANK